MPKCCALGCPPLGVPIHMFPHPEKFPEILKAWVEISGGKLVTPADYEFYRKQKICDIHFTDGDKNRNKRLNALAVPTLHLPSVQSRARSSSHATLTHVASTSTEPTQFKPKEKYQLKRVAEKGSITYQDGINDGTVEYGFGEIKLATCEEGNDYSTKGQVHDNGETTFTQTPEAEYDETLFESHDLTTELEEETVAPRQETPKQEHIFSWQKEDAVVPCDTAEHIKKKEEVKEEEEQISETLELDWHLNIQCNICKNDIHGFRYVCVQCPDYDLCSTCEARRAHSAHYVLRVPGPRPESELQQVLRTIRQALAASILQLDNEAPVEVKEEEEDPLVDAPAADPPDGSTVDELQSDEEYEDVQYLSDDESVCSSTKERQPERLEETEPEKMKNEMKTYSSTAPSLTQILCIKKNAIIRLNRDSVLRKPIAKARIQKPIILKNSKRFEDLQRRLVKPPQAQIQRVQITQDRVETLQKSAEKRTCMPAKASPAKIRILNTSTASSIKAEPNQKEPKAVLRKVDHPIDSKFNLKAYVPVPRLPTITALNADKDNTKKLTNF